MRLDDGWNQIQVRNINIHSIDTEQDIVQDIVLSLVPVSLQYKSTPW